ncbi:GNAT family N-acetyltransferase [Nocardioides sp. JQ2195]|uniref:GNAT family N-acetyltransferase n=1 Tax=Nocardioides sp. JQ2195 TaxID=2592334 RepID=UPI00143E2EAE|nr:GNAT family N-acetyltransferase [Nocardioides sp. JQ2195]QIX26287.1 GNAT family N-acetyltransferase [Nocardioides sp. JQ2195]
MNDVLIRPLHHDDVPVVERLSAEGFFELDLRTHQRSWPDPQLRPADRAASWIRRTRHLIDTDPGGCWAATRGEEIVGFATSFNREKMWILSSYVVRPGLQGQGIGVQLLAAALHHGRGCLRGMFAASDDPKALRRYRAAGFELHSQMVLHGQLDRSVIPVVEKVREGSIGDRDLMDSIDRQTRGAAHGPDHEFLLSDLRLIVTERSSGSGYAYVDDHGSPLLLAATTRRTAVDLMWEALASSPADALLDVGHVTSANHWALDVGLAARLSIHHRGYLMVRDMLPPSPYLHHGSLL